MRRNIRIGRRAERRAARYLERRGLRILARNVRCGRHEIDLLARDDQLPVIVEVRYRAAGILAADRSVTREKERHLRAAWRRLARERGLPPATAVRFDLVLVAPGREPCHVPGVF